jgi:formylmethanofuran dehydrogenase subunit E
MRRLAVALVAIAIAGCAGAGASAGGGAGASDRGLAEVAAIHGGAGPWAVAGYRMGQYALQKLGVAKQSFDLEVTHHTPPKVQYSCIADGASAATGASAGKLNLKLVDASDADVATTYKRKSTGQSVTLRPTASFAARFKDVPREKLSEAGREVMKLPDAEIFEEVAAP